MREVIYKELKKGMKSWIEKKVDELKEGEENEKKLKNLRRRRRKWESMVKKKNLGIREIEDEDIIKNLRLKRFKRKEDKKNWGRDDRRWYWKERKRNENERWKVDDRIEKRRKGEKWKKLRRKRKRKGKGVGW